MQKKIKYEKIQYKKIEYKKYIKKYIGDNNNSK